MTTCDQKILTYDYFLLKLFQWTMKQWNYKTLKLRCSCIRSILSTKSSTWSGELFIETNFKVIINFTFIPKNVVNKQQVELLNIISIFNIVTGHTTPLKLEVWQQTMTSSLTSSSLRLTALVDILIICL